MRERRFLKLFLLLGFFIEQVFTSYFSLILSSPDYFYHSIIGNALLHGKVFWNPMYQHREVFYDYFGKVIFGITGKHFMLASFISALVMTLALWFVLELIKDAPLFYFASLLAVSMYVIGNLGPRPVQFSYLLYAFLFYRGITLVKLDSKWLSELFVGTILISLLHGSYQLVPVLLLFVILLREDTELNDFLKGIGVIFLAVAVYFVFMASQGMTLKEFFRAYGYARQYSGVITEWSSMFSMFNALPLAILVSFIFIYSLSDDKKSVKETIVFSLLILFSVSVQRIFMFFLPVMTYLVAKRKIGAVPGFKLDPIGASFSAFILPFGIVAIAGLPRGKKVDNNITKIKGNVVFIHPADGIKAYFYNPNIHLESIGDYKLYEEILKYTRGNKISSQELFFFDRSNAVYKFFLGKNRERYYLGVTPLTETHFTYILMWLLRNEILNYQEVHHIHSIRSGDYTFYFWK